MRNIVQVKELQAKSRALEVRRNGQPSILEVQSGADPTKFYQVRVLPSGELLCNCTWAGYGGVNCKHILAVHRYLASLAGRKVSFWLSEEDAQRQKAKMVKRDGLYITAR